MDDPTPADLIAARALLAAVLADLGLAAAYRDGTITRPQREAALTALIDRQRAAFRADAEALRAEMTPAAFGAGDLVGRWWGRMRSGLRETLLAAALALSGPDLGADEIAAVEGKAAVQAAYLDRFAAQLRSGDQKPDGSLVNRAGMYADSAWAAAFAALAERARRDGATHGKRVLGEANQHCSVCPDEAAKGWVPIAEVVPIGQSPCQNACRCTILYTSDPSAEFAADEPVRFAVDLDGWAVVKPPPKWAAILPPRRPSPRPIVY